MLNGSLSKESWYLIHIDGLVQGVGFRPFIYRLATEMQLSGMVGNRNDGVFIKIRGSENDLRNFENRIRKESPPAACIHSISIHKSEPELLDDFRIIESKNTSEEITGVSPDIAVCADCLEDMERQIHRKDYPFINCTNCGPRFSIIKELPYDRHFTSMEPFRMCKSCNSEYTDVADRRFHAQPIACNVCGPVYRMISGKEVLYSLDDILNELSEGIASGKVYALKGTGGFHLMCDAWNQAAVLRIREIKKRDAKPFAIMASGISEIKENAEVDENEERLLQSWQRPIVLLKSIGRLAGAVSNGLNKVGVMLPYMPFHYLMFKKLKTQHLVLTSGNITDEPILIGNEEASSVFGNSVDGIIDYNREIYNRADDSVCIVVNEKPMILRRSRAFTPQPVFLNLQVEGIFAAGAELVNSFCIGKAKQAIMSQYIGDLKNLETLSFYEETYRRFEKLFRFKPRLVAMDMHPDYLSSRFASDLSEKHHIPLVKIQHHHAHIASVMASHQLDTEVIGVSFDGTGMGDDGKIRGAEFLAADLVDFERLLHFEEIPLPGGDRASIECWRMAVSYLYRVFGEELFALDLPLFRSIEENKVSGIVQLIEKRINSPMVSSAGRLFDAVSSIIGLAHYNSFQAEAAMRLEASINPFEKRRYDFDLSGESISFTPTIKQIVADCQQGIGPDDIAAKFHNTIVEVVVDSCMNLAKERANKIIVLSGGTFQNHFLSAAVEKRLSAAGLKVYLPKSVPVNDQGIALGQLAIAAKRHSSGLI